MSEKRWDERDQQPVLTAEAMQRAFDAIFNPPYKPRSTVHHPRCDAVGTQDIGKCNCGGWMFA